MSYETVNVDSPLDLPLHGCWEIRLPPPNLEMKYVVTMPYP